MKRLVVLSMLLIQHLAALPQLPDAGQIISRSRDLTLSGSMSENISLTITEKNGLVRKRIISLISKSYPDGTEKRMIKFIEPADVKGTGLLITDYKNSADEMWIYLPALKRTRRVVSNEKSKSFMSSEFSNSDMSSPSLSDFTYKHHTSSGENGQYIIESTPVNNEKADEYGYSRKLSYFNSGNLQLNKMEYFNFDNQLYKTMIVKSIHPLTEGRYIIKSMFVNNVITGRSSEISLDKIVTDSRVDDSVFSLQNLER